MTEMIEIEFEEDVYQNLFSLEQKERFQTLAELSNGYEYLKKIFLNYASAMEVICGKEENDREKEVAAFINAFLVFCIAQQMEALGKIDSANDWLNNEERLKQVEDALYSDGSLQRPENLSLTND